MARFGASFRVGRGVHVCTTGGAALGALESLLASDAQEATVTLSYLPGGDWPARIDLLLDDVPSTALARPRSFGKLESEWLHGLFVHADARLTELARWRHQVRGMPWEAGQSKASARRTACDAVIAA